MLGIYAAVAGLLAASWVVGHALLRGLGSRIEPGLAPAFGFALILIVALPAIQLPGHDVTALAALALLVAASIAVLGGRPPAPTAAALWLALAVLLAVTLPFAANGRYGVLASGISDDFGLNLAFVEVLQGGGDVAELNPQFYDGYPVGAHALAGAAGALPGVSELATLSAVAAACPLLIALCVCASLTSVLGPLRASVCGGLAGLCYIVAASYGVGHFKELIVAALAVAFALALRSLWRGDPTTSRDGMALGVLVAGGVSASGLPAAAWPLAFAGAAIGLGLLRGRGRLGGERSAQVVALVVPALIVSAILLAPQLGRHVGFEPEATAAGGSDPGQFGGFLGDREVNAQQALGIWPSEDLRRDPTVPLLADLGAAVALVAALLGSIWWFRRDDPVPPLCALAATAIALAAAWRYGPYITAKTIVAVGPLLAVLVFAPLLAWTRAGAGRGLRLAAGTGLVLLGGLAVWSSFLVLRGSAVGPLDRASELEALAGEVGDRPLLFIANDDYAPWELDGTRLSAVLPYGAGPEVPFRFRPGREPVVHGRPDFDQIVPRTLDRFDYVIVTRSGYASIPPQSWKLARRTRSFLLYERRGPTGARRILDRERSGPGAVLDCRSPAGAALTRRPGVAGVRPEPLIGPADEWRIGSRLPRFVDAGYAAAPADTTLSRQLRLAAGEWELSLQYHSPWPLKVEAGGRVFRLPAELSPRGNFWRVGLIRSRGEPVRVSVSPDSPGPLAASSYYSEIGPLAAVRRPVTSARIVALSSACGRYVDWYRLARPDTAAAG